MMRMPSGRAARSGLWIAGIIVAGLPLGAFAMLAGSDAWLVALIMAVPLLLVGLATNPVVPLRSAFARRLHPMRACCFCSHRIFPIGFKVPVTFGS